MGSKSNIEWTDASWNPVYGCSMTSPGCAHCYAERMGARLRGMALAAIKKGRDPGKLRHYLEAIGENGKWTGKLIPVPEALEIPLRWAKPRRVFVNSMSDLFHESVPFEFIDQVIQVIVLLPRHTFQVLTKRAGVLAKYMREVVGDGPTIRWGDGDHLMGMDFEFPVHNLWLGVSVENRKCLARVEELRRVPAAVRFLSLEPLLEDLGTLDLTSIHWVIVGGESGRGARPCALEWIWDIVQQCRAAGVPVFVKQAGAFCVTTNANLWDCYGSKQLETWGDNAASARVILKDSKGGDWNEWPQALQVREMPPLAAVTAPYVQSRRPKMVAAGVVRKRRGPK